MTFLDPLQREYYATQNRDCQHQPLAIVASSSYETGMLNGRLGLKFAFDF
jgi:hypothetical protein